ncbi:MAG: hypothetical protein DWQ47_04670 [Acidobacteria bacterium]|nr:MAG: hypothetical protein DWQ32_08220 [Acidobacteriota bacterium]REK01681.1 MAG: hypothetical protein DWQ38_04655 [Acidobacteriota bacterium]REK14637.1 MAG: hypothetical protein DWQ43_13910 [Acidobacteriota bacterium]REK45352.1 MAG: hypothetical protein DWQ47_04670 [Acidobacteriota bacterium]
MTSAQKYGIFSVAKIVIDDRRTIRVPNIRKEWRAWLTFQGVQVKPGSGLDPSQNQLELTGFEPTIAALIAD